MTALVSETLDLIVQALGFGFLLTLFLASMYVLG
jgi:hypothetical protein